MTDIVPVGTDLTEYKWSPDQLDLIRRTVAKGQDLTPDELLLFGYVCKQSGLDPFLKQIYPIKFKDSKSGQKDLNFITGINGYRTIAERTGVYAGRDDILYDEGLTQIQMLELRRPIPRTATCTVYKLMGGIRNPTTATVRWIEYYPKGQSKAYLFWDPMPFNQLGKVSEAASLKVAFPGYFKGIYLDAEFHRTEARPAYQMTDETFNMIEDINVIYTGMLGYNPAQMIAKNIEITGESDLHRVPKEKLDVLKYQLQALVEKQDAEEVIVEGEVINGDTEEE